MKNVSSFNNALKFGFILAIFQIVYFLVAYVLDMQDGGSGSFFISLIIAFGIFFFGTKNFREKALDGYISFGKAFGHSFLIGLFGYIISSIFSFIFYTLIDNEYLNQMFLKAVDELDGKNIPEQAYDQSVKWMEMMFTPTAMLIMGILIGLLISLIVSLIVAAVVKKEQTIA